MMLIFNSAPVMEGRIFQKCYRNLVKYAFFRSTFNFWVNFSCANGFMLRDFKCIKTD